ncbi:MAG: hypothetical protein KAH77_07760 [Thiomargarita sp.]|nr:hypothetical protein [Thiomargarita sp.]
MNAFRLILLILFVWILWHFGRRWYQHLLQKSQTTIQQKTMVQCHSCKLYLPEEEAYYSDKDNTYYCCEAHKHSAQ